MTSHRKSPQMACITEHQADNTRYRPREYLAHTGSTDPITGGGGAILGAVGNLMLGTINIPLGIAKAVICKSPEALQPPRHDSARAFSDSTASTSGKAPQCENPALRVPSTSECDANSMRGRELLHPAVRDSSPLSSRDGRHSKRDLTPSCSGVGDASVYTPDMSSTTGSSRTVGKKGKAKRKVTSSKVRSDDDKK